MKVDIGSLAAARMARLQGGEPPPVEQGKPFSEVLLDRINQLNDLQVKANSAVTSFVLGEGDDLHQVMITKEEARLALQYAMQVRNKVVEAYQEISRMQL